MPHISRHTPFGDLTLAEENGALVSLDWGWAPLGQGATPLLDRAWGRLMAYFSGDPAPFSLPFRPAGTAFQRRVWTRLMTIPHGGLTTYGALALALGSSARAVGGACGRNPLPILIPCHRVIAGGGGLGGYSGDGGRETKCRLLALEGVTEPAIKIKVSKKTRP